MATILDPLRLSFDVARCDGRDEKGTECYKRKQCLRHLAPGRPYYQVYMMAKSVDKCDSYIEVKN